MTRNHQYNLDSDAPQALNDRAVAEHSCNVLHLNLKFCSHSPQANIGVDDEPTPQGARTCSSQVA